MTLGAKPIDGLTDGQIKIYLSIFNFFKKCVYNNCGLCVQSVSLCNGKACIVLHDALDGCTCIVWLPIYVQAFVKNDWSNWRYYVINTVSLFILR